MNNINPILIVAFVLCFFGCGDKQGAIDEARYFSELTNLIDAQYEIYFYGKVEEAKVAVEHVGDILAPLDSSNFESRSDLILLSKIIQRLRLARVEATLGDHGLAKALFDEALELSAYHSDFSNLTIEERRVQVRAFAEGIDQLYEEDGSILTPKFIDFQEPSNG